MWLDIYFKEEIAMFYNFAAVINILIVIGVWAGIIYLIISIFRYFRDYKQLKIEQNELLEKIHQELELGNSK